MEAAGAGGCAELSTHPPPKSLVGIHFGRSEHHTNEAPLLRSAPPPSQPQIDIHCERSEWHDTGVAIAEALGLHVSGLCSVGM